MAMGGFYLAVAAPKNRSLRNAHRRSRRGRSAAAPDELLLDIPQLVLAEKDLAADKEGRRAEGAAGHRRLGVAHQLLLHLGGLGALEQASGIEAIRDQDRANHLGLIQLFRVAPHGVEHGLNVALEASF